ncbi:hypothetical protein [Hyphomicrobium sp. D-2]|uniref:hypothetical protein n=1 Tax=Hyphomicrobium sp. D-2 TaxID=3041621 RepID=UPI0024545C55|nr:hypothetical protein [Hyphomicrobium sp. D-2]MDH4980932.1 hypothetical protein [Hyphomicrobium sp. D-2]
MQGDGGAVELEREFQILLDDKQRSDGKVALVVFKGFGGFFCVMHRGQQRWSMALISTARVRLSGVLMVFLLLV